VNSSERVADLLLDARKRGHAASALDELRTVLTETLTDLLSPSVNGPVIAEAVAAATADWTATRKQFPHRDQHPLEDSTHGHQVIAALPFVPEADDERLEREARTAARTWAACAARTDWNREDPRSLGDDVGPPPERVGILHLLEQGLWWRMRDLDATDPDGGGRVPTVAIRLEDMTHDHRLALLDFLRRRAPQYKIREDWYYASTPGPSGDMASDAFEAECNRQWATPAAEWIENQPLVQALVYWTTPYAESPLTWRPMSEAPHDGREIVARWFDGGDLDESDRIYWSPFGHCWHIKGGSNPFSSDVFAEWRELRDDEKPPPPPPECEHEGFDEQDCGICGSEFHPCRHGGTRDSDYCSACEQE
jgi:hypothetical protein